jgi:hypothetical protein
MSMPALVCEATPRSPEISFAYDRHHLTIRGKSYPEDAVAFYVPVLNSLKDYLQPLEGTAVTVDIELLYFNSSSAKALMNLLLMLEDAAGRGNPVTVNWHYAEDDETMQEYGEEFAEDLEQVTFKLVPVAG